MATRFSNAVIVTTSPLAVTLFGDTAEIPARNYYGLTLTIGDRVRMELLPPPSPPIIAAVLS